MKTLLSIFAVLALSVSAHAGTITKADIIKTVEHLQVRCHEAEAAQVDAQNHAATLQASIDALAAHDQLETEKADQLTAVNQKLAWRLDKLVWALAACAGLLAWACASKLGAALPAPYNLAGPIVAGLFVAASVFGYLRYAL